MTSQVSSATSSLTQDPSASAGNSSGLEVTADMFLELLVAELKHQDPLNPADGTEFLTQLAQIQQVAETNAMRNDIQAIRENLDRLSSGSAGTPPEG